MNVRDLLIDHEGLMYKLYKCTAGKQSIGVGRNLEDNGLSHAEVMFLLDNDIATATKTCEAYPWFASLSDARKAACIDLAFNLGATRLRGFVKFLAAMAAQDYKTAGDELVDSKWYKQVGKRGPNVVHLIRYEAWPT